MASHQPKHDASDASIHDGNVCISFGKHRGKKLRDLPDRYLMWCLQNFDSRKATWLMIKGEIDRRDARDAYRQCPSVLRATNNPDPMFEILTGPRATKHRLVSECVPVVYPPNWESMSKNQRKKWKRQQLENPVPVIKPSPYTDDQPAIPPITPVDLALAARRGIGAMVADMNRSSSEPLTAADCPF